MKLSFVTWNDDNFIQKSGICIGSCLAPILSDIYLARHDRHIATKLDGSVVFKVCRFVDDFLILVWQGDDCKEHGNSNKKRFVVLPYIHNGSHRLKIGACANLQVTFSAPEKLQKSCQMVNAQPSRVPACSVKHRTRFVSCAVGVVYSIPLTCGKSYIGQTGRCLNDRLHGHHNNVFSMVQGHISIHCRDCRRTPHFNQSKVVARHRVQLTREVIKAELIHKLGDKCISAPSIALSDQEFDNLAGL